MEFIVSTHDLNIGNNLNCHKRDVWGAGVGLCGFANVPPNA